MKPKRTKRRTIAQIKAQREIDALQLIVDQCCDCPWRGSITLTSDECDLVAETLIGRICAISRRT